MMPVTPITSKQVVRVADLASIPLREVVATILEEALFDGDVLQRKIIEDGATFQVLLRSEFEASVRRALLRLSGVRHPAASDLEKYFLEVFGIIIDLTGVPFPEKVGMPAYMARPEGLDENFVLDRLVKHFGVEKYTWKSPVAQHIDRKNEQQRPQGLYVFAHVGGDEPDAKHLGKSYDDASEAKMVFANPLEYLLMTGFHMWKHKKWMDMKGWTRTSSVWLGGLAVDGYFDPGDRELCLYFDDRGRRRPGAGPRELFLG